MEIEQLEIYDFLASCYPLNKLTEQDLKALAQAIEISYTPRGATVLVPGENNPWLYLIRSGAVMRTDHADGLVAQFAAKDFFGHKALERGGLIKNKVSCMEDSLFYLIPQAQYQQLMQANNDFRNYFTPQKSQRLKTALTDIKAEPDHLLIDAKITEFLHHKPLLVDPATSIRDCAQLMRDQQQTAALVMHEEQLLGIVTDRVFCTKVVAEQTPIDAPIEDVMTAEVVTIEPNNTGLEAMLMMARLNIRHLPVVGDGQLLGLVTATDLIHQQSHNPIYLVNQIHKAHKPQQLVKFSQQLPTALCQLVDAGLQANDIAYSISSIGRAITQKAIRLAMDHLGPPPVKFAYLVAGSLARNDQTAHSDQDNCLLLSDAYEPKQHGPYFSALANQVSDTLNQCGYVYCPGDVMASNDRWRQPLSTWKTYFNRWIKSPEPKALMYASIFFDLRCVYGETSLLQELHQHINGLIKGNRLFLAYMAVNAQQNKPPLGVFRRFVLEKHGAETKSLDIKKRGIMPCTDLARVFALDAQTTVINTRERLQQAQQAGIISSVAADDLIDSYDFISTVRLQHQAKNIRSGQAADNYVDPKSLSSLESRHLKDAFELLRTYQEVLNKQYTQGHM